MLALLMVQMPVLAVTQLAEPPGEKLPLTVAFATIALVLMSRIVTAAYARQLAPLLAEFPDRDLTATTCFSASFGAPAASE